MTELIIQQPNLGELIKSDLIGVVRDHAANAPRSQQVAIGASEIGSPCDRQLALKSLGYVGSGRSGDPWAQIIGTAVHFWLEQAFSADDVALLPPNKRWKTETRVDIAPGIKGTADLYSYKYKTVIDHKVPGDSTMDKARRDKISQTYQVQAQCYAYGFEQAGYDVSNVAIAYWPRGNGAWLGGLHVWTDTYRPDVAKVAIERWYSIVNAAIALDLEGNVERAELFATADAPCRWCPFWRAKGSEGSCTGHYPKKTTSS